MRALRNTENTAYRLTLKTSTNEKERVIRENEGPDGRSANEPQRPQQSAGKGALREVYRLTCSVSPQHNYGCPAVTGRPTQAVRQLHLTPISSRNREFTTPPNQSLSFFHFQGFTLSSGFSTQSIPARKPVIGILGGIGSGKSSVVRHTSGHKLHIIDADKVGHRLLSDADIQNQLRMEFGEDVFSNERTIDRSQLAKLVFGETLEHQQALKQLNAILHPAIRREIHLEIDSVSRDVDAVILDAALLLEGGWDATCDWLIFVDTPETLRQQRVQENRGWSADELSKREATQWSIATKKERADFVVDNSGTIQTAAAQMTQIFDSLLPPGT